MDVRVFLSYVVQFCEYNIATRELDFTVSVTAHTEISQDVHALSILILEDKVTGVTTDYAQANNYSESTLSVPLVGLDGVNWRSLPDPVPASDMVYDDVVRDLIGGIEGIEDAITDAVDAQSQTYSDTYTLPSTFDENEVWIVALLLDRVTGEIIQAYEEELLLPSSVKDSEEAVDIDIYPNPATNYINIGIAGLGNQKLDLNVKDSNGESVGRFSDFDGQHIDVSSLPAGFYTLTVKGAFGSHSRPFIVLSR